MKMFIAASATVTNRTKRQLCKDDRAFGRSQKPVDGGALSNSASKLATENEAAFGPSFFISKQFTGCFTP